MIASMFCALLLESSTFIQQMFNFITNKAIPHMYTSSVNSFCRCFSGAADNFAKPDSFY